MNCKNCGALLDEEATVCPGCGAALENPVTEPAEEDLTAVPEEVVVSADPAESIEVTATEEAGESEVVEITEEFIGIEAEKSPEEATPAVNPKRRTLLRVLAIVCCVALALALGLGIWTGINGGLKPRKNDIQRLDDYSAEGNRLLGAMDTVVATIGNAQLTNGQLQILYWNEVYRFLQDYGNYLAYFGMDMSKSLAEQYVSEGGLSYQQYFLDAALDNWHSYQALAQQGNAKGFEMSDEFRAQLDTMEDSLTASAVYYGFESAEALIQADMGPGATLEDYMAYMELYMYAMEYFDSLYFAMDPAVEEITAYYEANTDSINSTYQVSKDGGKRVDVRHILILPQGGTQDENGQTTYSEEEWETCRLAAQKVLEDWQNGLADEDYFAELAATHSEDPGSSANGGLYTFVYPGQMVPEFDAWCFDESRQPGDTGLVRTTYGYHVMYYVFGDEGWLRAAKESYLSYACGEILQNAKEASPMEVTYRKIRLGNADLS